MLLALYGRALATKVLDADGAGAVLHMREDDRKHYDALVPLLGEAAPVASAYDITFPKGTFDSARAILREAVKLERMLVGTLVTGLAATQDDETRLLLARILRERRRPSVRGARRPASGTGLRARAAVVRSASRSRASSSTRTSASRASTTRGARPRPRPGGEAHAPSARTRHAGPLAARRAAALAAPASASALTVSAAASLRDALPKIDGSPTYNFAGSDALALQIRNGVPADVFLSANLSIPAQLFKDGLCTKPRVFATNVVVMVTPTANPAGIKNVYDLGRGERKRLAIGSATVPIGIYTRPVLGRLGLSRALRVNTVSSESNVTSVLVEGRARHRRRRLRLRHGLAVGQERRQALQPPEVRPAAGALRHVRRQARRRRHGRGEHVHAQGARPRRPQAAARLRLRRAEADLMASQSAVRRGAFGVLLTACLFVALAFLLIPILAIFLESPLRDLPDLLSQQVVRDAIVITLETNIVANLLILGFGTPAAYFLATRRFRGRNVVLTLVELPLVLPPAVAGVGLLAAFGTIGLIGDNLEA